MLVDPQLRRQGKARAALLELGSIADRLGLTLYIEPAPSPKGRFHEPIWCACTKDADTGFPAEKAGSSWFDTPLPFAPSSYPQILWITVWSKDPSCSTLVHTA